MDEIIDETMGGVWKKIEDEYSLFIDGNCVGKVKKNNFRIQQLKLRDACRKLSKELRRAALHDFKTIFHFVKKLRSKSPRDD